MAEYWTIQQAAANAELFAKEFSNRQILLYGLGEPILQAPVGVEYEDRAFTPPKRFRKVGLTATDWTEIKIVVAATEEEVSNGVNDEKMITPLSLANRLGEFTQQVLGLPKPSNLTQENGVAQLIASNDASNAAFKLSLPNGISTTSLPVQVIGYGQESSVENITGGSVGQIITVRRGENHALKLNSTAHIKLSDEFILTDINRYDNITLQRLTESVWGELSRKRFT